MVKVDLVNPPLHQKNNNKKNNRLESIFFFKKRQSDVANCRFARLLFRQKSVSLLHLLVFRRQSVLVLPGEPRYLISVDGGSVTHLPDEPSVRVPQSAGWSATINAFNPPLGPMSSC